MIKKQFNNFVSTPWWNFKKKLTNFRHNYGVTERSALGYHAFNISYFKATLLPEVMNQPDPGSTVEHLTNNYYDKFSDIKKNNFLDIRGTCRFKISEIFDENNYMLETIISLYLKKLFNVISWKLRFMTRLFRN